MTRIMVTGSRDWYSPEVVEFVLGQYYDTDPNTVLVVGDCPTGADAQASAFWRANGGIVERHLADWRCHGRAAGPLRNRAMVLNGADVCLAFIRNKSKGATGCVDLAERAGIPTRVWEAP